MDCSLPGSSLQGILQARKNILGWVAISFSRGSSRPRNWTQVSCIAGSFFTDWAMREVCHKGCFKNEKRNQLMYNQPSTGVSGELWKTSKQQFAETNCLKTFLAALRRIKLGEGKTSRKKPGRDTPRCYVFLVTVLRDAGLFLFLLLKSYLFCFLFHKMGITCAHIIELKQKLNKLICAKLLVESIINHDLCTGSSFEHSSKSLPGDKWK